MENREMEHRSTSLLPEPPVRVKCEPVEDDSSQYAGLEDLIPHVPENDFWTMDTTFPAKEEQDAAADLKENDICARVTTFPVKEEKEVTDGELKGIDFPAIYTTFPVKKETEDAVAGLKVNDFWATDATFPVEEQKQDTSGEYKSSAASLNVCDARDPLGETACSLKQESPSNRLDRTGAATRRKNLETTRKKKKQKVKKEKGPFPCPVCHKLYAHRCHLNWHVRLSHTKDNPGAPVRPFECSECGSAFATGALMQAHALTHSGERPYACTCCSKRFLRNCDLQRHMLTHSGERPYPCSFCGRAFAQSGTMKKHILTHMRAKQFPCETCGRSYSQPGSLIRHQRQHSPQATYQCVCGAPFTRREQLIAHTQRHHL